jgi:hypothetical protein
MAIFSTRQIRQLKIIVKIFQSTVHISLLNEHKYMNKSPYQQIIQNKDKTGAYVQI